MIHLLGVDTCKSTIIFSLSLKNILHLEWSILYNVIQEKIQWKHPWNIISFSSSNVEEILCWGSPKRVMGKRKLLWNIPAVALNHHFKINFLIWNTVSVKTYFKTSIDRNSSSWLSCMFAVQPIISRLLTVFQSNKAISMSKMHSWIWSRLYCLFCQD